MKRLVFDTVKELAIEVNRIYSQLKDTDKNVSIVAKYEVTNKILCELLKFGYDIASVDLHIPEYEDYYDEYIITIDEYGVWCEKSKRNDNYLGHEADHIYVLDDCNSKLLGKLDSEFLYEVGIGDDTDNNVTTLSFDETGFANIKYIINKFNRLEQLLKDIDF